MPDLTIGFQPHTDEKGPLFDSPLCTIDLKRNIVLTQEYAEAQNEWDEGIFAYTYWNGYDGSDDANNWLTELNIGPQVKQISDYMFSVSSDTFDSRHAAPSLASARCKGTF